MSFSISCDQTCLRASPFPNESNNTPHTCMWDTQQKKAECSWIAVKVLEWWATIEEWAFPFHPLLINAAI